MAAIIENGGGKQVFNCLSFINKQNKGIPRLIMFFIPCIIQFTKSGHVYVYVANGIA